MINTYFCDNFNALLGKLLYVSRAEGVRGKSTVASFESNDWVEFGHSSNGCLALWALGFGLCSFLGGAAKAHVDMLARLQHCIIGNLLRADKNGTRPSEHVQALRGASPHTRQREESAEMTNGGAPYPEELGGSNFNVTADWLTTGMFLFDLPAVIFAKVIDALEAVVFILTEDFLEIVRFAGAGCGVGWA